MNERRIDQIRAVYYQQFGGEPASFAVAPGRINLIGEHTDYSEGFVLPVAIDRDVMILFSPRPDDRVLIYSIDFDDRYQTQLTKLERQDHTWAKYVQGVAWALSENGYPLKGWQGVISGNIPIGAGLSSSAALQIAIGKTFCLASNVSIDPTTLALIAQKAEIAWVGVNVGIMDQLVSAAGKADCAVLLDCKTLDYEYIPIPEAASFVVLDTLTRRELTNSEYNTRHEEIQKVTAILGLHSLREASASHLARCQERISTKLMKRAKHVINENNRVIQFVDAMRSKDLILMGSLINESHVSLRDDYEVSSDVLNLIVDLANNQPGCFGARMMGAGFGGCALALLGKSEEADFIHAVSVAYREEMGVEPNAFIVKSAHGARAQTL